MILGMVGWLRGLAILAMLKLGFGLNLRRPWLLPSRRVLDSNEKTSGGRCRVV